MTPGDTPVESSFDRQTGLYMSNCFAAHSEYRQWVKQEISLGREIHTITIAQLLAHLDETRGK